MSKLSIRLIVFLWTLSISNISALELIENPPIAPAVGEINEVERPFEENATIENPPSTPDINESSIVENPPSTPDINESSIVENPPLTPDINESSLIENPPLTPDINESSLIENPPSTPDINESSLIENPPLTPDINEGDSNASDIPQIPNIDDGEQNISLTPEIPNIDDGEQNISLTPDIPNIDDGEQNISLTPDIPNIEIDLDIPLPDMPQAPVVEEKPFEYIIGNVQLPENSELSVEVELISLDWKVTGVDVDENRFFAIQLPKLSDGESKKYYIRVRTVDNSIQTEYFVDGVTGEIVLANSVDYVFNRDVAKYFPDIEPLVVTIDTENIGILDLKDIENSLAKVSGLIVANGDLEFEFEALDIATGDIIKFSNENLGYNRFGFKLTKDRSYTLILHTLTDGQIDSSYFLGYRDENSTEIELFSENELEFNSSNVPQFSKYIELNEDIEFDINLISYLNSIYSISGSVKVDQEDNLTITAIDSLTGQLLADATLKEYTTSTESYSYSLTLGRDMVDREFALFITLKSQPENVYIYDGSTSGIKLIKIDDFIESSSGFIPKSSLYTPLKVSSSSTSLNLDLTSIDIFKIDGNVTVPSTFKIGVVCKDSDNTLYYGDCNSSMERVGFNSISLQFLNSEDNSSSWIDIESGKLYSFESDRPQNIVPILHLFQYYDSRGETLHWDYILSDFGKSNSLVPYSESVEVNKLTLSENNSSVKLNFDLANLMTRRFTISGTLNLGDIDNILISVLDSEDNSILGVLETNLSNYSLPLDKFSDSNLSNNGVIFELTLSQNGDEKVLYFDGEKLTPLENIEFKDLNGTWIIDRDSSGFLNLNDTNINRVLNIDIPNLLSDLESSIYRVYGTISGDVNSSISLQVVDIDSENVVGKIYLQTDINGDVNYSISLFESGNYMLLIDSGDDTLFYNGERMLSIDYFNGVYPQPIALNSQIDLDITSSTISSSTLSISGLFTNYLDFNNSIISAYSLSGDWLGDGKIVDGSYSISLPLSQVSDSIVFKISNENGNYYLGSNNILLESKSVDVNSSGYLTFPSIFTPITLKSSNSKSGDLDALVQLLEEQKYKIYGQISSLSETMIGQLIDVRNGVYIDSVELQNGEYSIEANNGSEFVLYIFDGERELLFDFNNSKFIPADSVNFIEVNGVWVPNPKESGSIILTSSEKQKSFNLDLSNIDSMILDLSGDILLPSNSILGFSNNSQVWRGAYISVIDRVSGDEVSFIQIENDTNRSTPDGIEYSFNLSIDNSEMATRELIFKLYIYENSYGVISSRDIFYNFAEGRGENGKFIDLKDADWLETSVSRDDLYLDISLFGSGENILEIEIKRPVSFPLSEVGNSINLYLLSKDGEFIEYVTIKDDKNISLNLGESAGEYLLYLEFVHTDSLYPEESYTKEFYLDFPDHNRSSLKIVREDEIKFSEIDGEYIPNISSLYVDQNLSFVVDIEDRTSFELSGTITSSVEWKSMRMILKDYKSGKEYNSIVLNSKYLFKDVVEGEYTLRVSGESKDGDILSLFVTDSGNIDIDEVSWRLNRDGENSYYSPEDISLFQINGDKNIPIDLGDISSLISKYDINISLDRDVEKGELFIPNSSINYYLNCKRGDCFNSSDRTTLPFRDVTSKDGYYLQLKIDGKNYIYNPENRELESGVDWIAVDTNGDRVCSTSSENWECNWSNSYDWIWKPDREALDFSSLSENLEMNISTFQESRLSGNISFGSNYREKKFTLILYQLDDSVYEIYKTKSDSNGDLNLSLALKPLTDYRVELFSGNSYFVLSFENSEYKLISSGNSWSDDFATPKSETLFDLTSDLDLGNINLSQLYSLNITLENVATDEDIFVKLYGYNKEFSGSNIEVSNQILIPAESGEYNIVVYPSKHSSGYIVKEGSDMNFTEFNWSKDDALSFNIYSDRDIVISLPSNENLKSISGYVNLGDGDVESGWIEAYSLYNRQGAVVEDNGSYRIDGLKPSLDYNYTLQYRSWNFDDLVISKNVGVWAVGDLDSFDVDRSSYSYKFSGEILYSGEDSPDVRAILIEYDRASEEWRVLSKTKLEDDGSYLFENIQPSSGKSFYVSAGVRIKSSSGVTYNKFNATDGDKNISIVDLNSSISVTLFQESINN